MNFKEYWNSQDLDKYRTTEDYCKASWYACKEEILKMVDEHIFYIAGTNVVIKVNPLAIKREIEKL